MHMATFTKELTAVNEAGLAAAAAEYNNSNDLSLGKPADFVPLTPHQYLDLVVGKALKGMQDEHLRLTSGAFLLRFPPGKIDTIKAAAASNAQIAEYIAEVEANPYVYTGSTLVRGGIAMLVQAGLLTQAQADVILA